MYTYEQSQVCQLHSHEAFAKVVISVVCYLQAGIAVIMHLGILVGVKLFPMHQDYSNHKLPDIMISGFSKDETKLAHLQVLH